MVMSRRENIDSVRFATDCRYQLFNWGRQSNFNFVRAKMDD